MPLRLRHAKRPDSFSTLYYADPRACRLATCLCLSQSSSSMDTGAEAPSYASTFLSLSSTLALLGAPEENKSTVFLLLVACVVTALFQPMQKREKGEFLPREEVTPRRNFFVFFFLPGVSRGSWASPLFAAVMAVSIFLPFFPLFPSSVSFLLQRDKKKRKKRKRASDRESLKTDRRSNAN